MTIRATSSRPRLTTRTLALFDLAADPAAARNVADQFPARPPASGDRLARIKGGHAATARGKLSADVLKLLAEEGYWTLEEMTDEAVMNQGTGIRRAWLWLFLFDAVFMALHAWYTGHRWYVENFALGAYEHPAYELLRTFNLDAEGTSAVWYSSLKLFLAAALAAGCWALARREGRSAFGWLMVALIFLGLSVDESASLHEHLADLIMAMEGRRTASATRSCTGTRTNGPSSG